MKKSAVLAICVLSGWLPLSQAEIINGVEITHSTLRAVDVAHTTNLNITAVGNIDWVLMGSNSVDIVSESKLGGTAFDNFATLIPASRMDLSESNRVINFNWTDGDPTVASAGTEMGVKVTSFTNGFEEVVSFDLNLEASTNEYRLRVYLSDQRLSTRMRIWDETAADWTILSEESDNDALDLRVHKIFITGVESNITLKFGLEANQVKATHSLRTLPAFALELDVPTVPPSYAVDWSGTEIVTNNINSPTRTESKLFGAGGGLSWGGYAFDPDTEVLFGGLNPSTLGFKGGAVAYSTDPAVVADMDRQRIANASPNDTVWFRFAGNIPSNGTTIASAYLWTPTQAVTLDSITNLTVQFNNLGAPGSEARLLLTTAGQQYVSEPVGWTNAVSYALDSVSNLMWAAYAPADLTPSGGVVQAGMDLRFDSAITGAFTNLAANSAVEQIGIAAEVHSLFEILVDTNSIPVATNGISASVNMARFQMIVIPALEPGYAPWIASFNLTGSPNADRDYDFDGDGVVNLYEYGLGGDPTNAADAGYIPAYSVLDQDGTNYFEYAYARRVGDDHGLVYRLELAPNLMMAAWTNMGYVELPDPDILEPGIEEVVNRVETEGKSEEFLRLVIEDSNAL
jgi:hypothetical protein